VWDRKTDTPDAAPLRYHVPPELGDDGTFWAHSLAFDDDGRLLITDFSRGRVERWDLERNVKLGVLADSEQAGKYLELERAPDGLVYLAGPDGIWRFDSRAASIAQVVPFFDARTIADRYPEPFSPASLTFVPRSALAKPAVAAER
jgi:hypothetical protein